MKVKELIKMPTLNSNNSMINNITSATTKNKIIKDKFNSNPTYTKQFNARHTSINSINLTPSYMITISSPTKDKKNSKRLDIAFNKIVKKKKLSTNKKLNVEVNNDVYLSSGVSSKVNSNNNIENINKENLKQSSQNTLKITSSTKNKLSSILVNSTKTPNFTIKINQFDTVEPFNLTLSTQQLTSNNRKNKNKLSVKLDNIEELMQSDKTNIKHKSSRKQRPEFDEDGFMIKTPILKSSNKLRQTNKQLTKDSLDQLFIKQKEENRNLELEKKTISSSPSKLILYKNKTNFIKSLAKSGRFVNMMKVKHRNSIIENKELNTIQSSVKRSSTTNIDGFNYGHRKNIISHDEQSNNEIINNAIDFVNIITEAENKENKRKKLFKKLGSHTIDNNNLKMTKLESKKSKVITKYDVGLKSKPSAQYEYNGLKLRIPYVNKSSGLNNFLIRDFGHGDMSSHVGKKNELIAMEFYKDNKKKLHDKQIEQNVEVLKENFQSDDDINNNISILNISNEPKLKSKKSFNLKDDFLIQEYERKLLTHKSKEKSKQIYNLINNISIEYDFDHEEIDYNNNAPIIPIKEKNIKRVLRLRKILSEGVDMDNDPLGIGNLKKLRSLINKNNEEIYDGLKRIGPPKFVKDKFKLGTNRKFKSLSGANFGKR